MVRSWRQLGPYAAASTPRLDDSGGSASRHRSALRYRGDSIVAVGADVAPQASDSVIDAGGLVLAPGFIDSHSYHDRFLTRTPDARGAVSQGITTIIAGQDGGHPIPLPRAWDVELLGGARMRCLEALHRAVRQEHPLPVPHEQADARTRARSRKGRSRDLPPSARPAFRTREQPRRATRRSACWPSAPRTDEAPVSSCAASPPSCPRGAAPTVDQPDMDDGGWWLQQDGGDLERQEGEHRRHPSRRS